MLINSIKELADTARDLAKRHKIPMREAIHLVADEHSVEPSEIAKELSRRSVERRKRKSWQEFIQKKAEQDQDYEDWRKNGDFSTMHIFMKSK